MSAAEALARLRGWPRRPLANLPTPLVPAPNLSAALGTGAPEILLKLDADTGCALGGNKVRKLEFELAPGRTQGVTHLITTGGPQSNHCRVTAGAAARMGVACVLVINGTEEGSPRGNALLQRLFGAEIHTVADRGDRAPAMAALARDIDEAGGKALVVPLGASTGLGSLGYALAADELSGQLDLLPRRARTHVFVSASSCGTLAGLLLGFSLLHRDDVRLVGVSADVEAGEMASEALRMAREGAALLGWTGAIRQEILACDDAQVGEGYGVATPAGDAATRLLGRTEGVALDPVYTAKASAGLLAWITEGRIPQDERVVFVHTGGHPALFT